MNKQGIEEKDCSHCLNRAKLMFDYYKRNADEETKYITIVFSLGYVAMITIYSTMYQHLLVQRKAVFIICLFISLFTFVVNEVWKMIMNFFENQYENKLWVQNLDNKITLEDLEYQTRRYNAKQYKVYYNAYPAIFITSLISGVIASVVLFLEAIYLTF